MQVGTVYAGLLQAKSRKPVGKVSSCSRRLLHGAFSPTTKCRDPKDLIVCSTHPFVACACLQHSPACLWLPPTAPCSTCGTHAHPGLLPEIPPLPFNYLCSPGVMTTTGTARTAIAKQRDLVTSHFMTASVSNVDPCSNCCHNLRVTYMQIIFFLLFFENVNSIRIVNEWLILSRHSHMCHQKYY